MHWLEFSVAADGEVAEAVIELFNRYGQGGAVVETSIDCLEHELSTTPQPSAVTVKTYLPLNEGARVLRQRLEEGLWHLGRIVPIPEPIVRELPEEDWANAWKKQYQPLRIGRKIQILPEHRHASAGQLHGSTSDRVVIRLEPGMAFGTGLHPTTRLCLEALEQCLAPESEQAAAHRNAFAHQNAFAHRNAPASSVLDVGTGSGILAIAAAKLGARSVLALDTDPVAVVVAQENVIKNGVSELVQVQHGTLPGGDGVFGSGVENLRVLQDGGPFDLVMINILAPVIVRLAPALARLLSPWGRLIAAGLVEDQEAEVERELLRLGLQVVERAQEEDWVALLAGRSMPEYESQRSAGEL